ncbi:hypothetical protein T484DRAFT_1747300 [Baffinella frigidus]|nr:hypothetical protein T484DRAFT_1747300 [Cryptophyta sp. CCMP2293]
MALWFVLNEILMCNALFVAYHFYAIDSMHDTSVVPRTKLCPIFESHRTPPRNIGEKDDGKGQDARRLRQRGGSSSDAAPSQQQRRTELFPNLDHWRTALSDAQHFHDLFAYVNCSIQRQRYERVSYRCSLTPPCRSLHLSPSTLHPAAHDDAIPAGTVKRGHNSVVH